MSDLKKVQGLMLFVALGLLLAGLTCFWLSWELGLLLDVVWRRSPDTIPFFAPSTTCSAGWRKGSG